MFFRSRLEEVNIDRIQKEFLIYQTLETPSDSPNNSHPRWTIVQTSHNFVLFESDVRGLHTRPAVPCSVFISVLIPCAQKNSDKDYFPRRNSYHNTSTGSMKLGRRQDNHRWPQIIFIAVLANKIRVAIRTEQNAGEDHQEFLEGSVIKESSRCGPARPPAGQGLPGVPTHLYKTRMK